MLHKAVLFTLLVPSIASAQFDLHFDGTVPVSSSGDALEMAWGGGLNFPQFSTIDLDLDGDRDLFAFDRSGNVVVTFLNEGGGTPNYVLTHQFDQLYPFRDLHDWVLLRDYNCDGKPDIFTYSLGGAAVYKNISDGSLAFQLVDTLVRSNYQPTDANLYITQVDIPGIEDIDNDGDLDILTFSIFGAYLDYHRNLSMELYGTCDSLVYEVRNRCWGYFSENANNNTVNLDNPCGFNVPNPEIALQIEAATAQLQREQHDPLAERAERAHVGSTILPIDLDGDAVKDLILGDVLFPNLVALSNGGEVDSAYMVTQDSLFPVYDVPVHLDIFPAPYYVDVTNDGIRDLLVSPNNTGLSQNYESVWYYKNLGSDAAPSFSFQQVDLFQDEMIEVGEGAYPLPFDHNGDGLMDLIVADYGYYAAGGNYPCKLALLENTGTLTQPAFDLVDDDYEDLSNSGIGQAMYPAFGDLDNDGDKDMYIGDLQGKLHYFENIATGPVADFQLTTPNVLNDGGVVIDVGQFASPQFFDVDGDGKLDMLAGERNGNVNYYHNIGTLGTPNWHLDNDSIGGVVVSEWWNVTGYSVPHMFINSDGERELLVGSESGWIHDYGDIDGNLNGTFTQLDTTWQDIREGRNSSISLYDFTGDGKLDAITGNYRGGLGFYRNDFGLAVDDQAGSSYAQAFSLSPNPANDAVTVELMLPLQKDMQLVLTDALGRELTRRPLRQHRVTFSTTSLRNGLYFVRAEAGDRSWTQRLVVMH